MTLCLGLTMACTEKTPEAEKPIQSPSSKGQLESFPKIKNLKKDSGYIIYYVDMNTEKIQLYWRDKNNRAYKSFENLKKELTANKKNLVFAMNAGIFMDDDYNTPLGLYIENGKVLRKINRKAGYCNFYLSPNGVFHINHHNKAGITVTADFNDDENYLFATQSGPMLIRSGKINPQFGENSQNRYIRNGVGITAKGKVVLIISETPVTFFEFSSQFQKLGCINALYLDGAISNYYPASAIPLISDFGPFMVVTAK